ncbi:ubiquitin-specific protease ubp14 [Datura stramonium]|uniref:Ubiquitin-specific protease ubp14 n=1 Tax=Datura stramonium TaxID=4076 RepID=A0ABS8TKT7_DATST|nr:ubiquitin-specific protease ubp14 [Datura stramonium]
MSEESVAKTFGNKRTAWDLSQETVVCLGVEDVPYGHEVLWFYSVVCIQGYCLYLHIVDFRRSMMFLVFWKCNGLATSTHMNDPDIDVHIKKPAKLDIDQSKVGTASDMDVTTSSGAAVDPLMPDGGGRYRLLGFVSHIGTSTQCGHYVAHIHKDSRWSINFPPEKEKRKMNAAAAKGSAWIVAASIGAVEALKDQGFARWNYALRSLHHYAKTNLIASNNTSARRFSTGSPAVVSGEKFRKTEETLNKVIDLSCWGPSTVRF